MYRFPLSLCSNTTSLLTERKYVGPAYSMMMTTNGSQLASEMQRAMDDLFHCRSKRHAIEFIAILLENQIKAAEGKVKELRSSKKFLAFTKDEVKRLKKERNVGSKQLALAENKYSEALRIDKLSNEENKAIIRQIIRYKSAAKDYIEERTRGLNAEKMREAEFLKIHDQKMLKAVKNFKAVSGK